MDEEEYNGIVDGLDKAISDLSFIHSDSELINKLINLRQTMLSKTLIADADQIYANADVFTHYCNFVAEILKIEALLDGKLDDDTGRFRINFMLNTEHADLEDLVNDSNILRLKDNYKFQLRLKDDKKTSAVTFSKSAHVTATVNRPWQNYFEIPDTIDKQKAFIPKGDHAENLEMFAALFDMFKGTQGSEPRNDKAKAVATRFNDYFNENTKRSGFNLTIYEMLNAANTLAPMCHAMRHPIVYNDPLYQDCYDLSRSKWFKGLFEGFPILIDAALKEQGVSRAEFLGALRHLKEHPSV